MKELKCSKSGKNGLVLRMDRKDPLVKELVKILRSSKRQKECQELRAASQDPPEIDPGG